MTSKNPVPYEPYGGSANLSARQAPGSPALGGGGDLGPGPGGPTTGIVQRTLAAIFRFKWMVLAIAVLGVGVGYVAMQFQNPEYETRALR